MIRRHPLFLSISTGLLATWPTVAAEPDAVDPVLMGLTSTGPAIFLSAVGIALLLTFLAFRTGLALLAFTLLALLAGLALSGAGLVQTAVHRFQSAHQILGVIERLFERIEGSLTAAGKTFEVIFVFDGGAETAWKALIKLKKAHPERITAIRLATVIASS